MSDVALRYLQAIHVAAMRHRGAHEPVLTDQTWQDLIVWAAPRGLMRRGSDDVRGIGVLWDDPRQFSPRERRYDVGVPIQPGDAERVDAPAFHLVTAPGRYLCATHTGPYEELSSFYDALASGPLASGEWTLLAQPIIEIYRNSPSEVVADELITEIYVPAVRT
jgi:DNA gyrase inhibitor GyrI